VLPRLAGATSAGCPLGQRGTEPHAGVEPAKMSLPRARCHHGDAARVELPGVAPGRRACKARRHPHEQPRQHVPGSAGAWSNGGVELSGIAPERASLPRTAATFRTTPWSRRESHSDFIAANDEGDLSHDPAPAPGIEPGSVVLEATLRPALAGIRAPIRYRSGSLGRQPSCNTCCTIGAFVSSPRVERGTCALGMRRPPPAGRGDG
jgi:hypothetical protein